ncbi:MAG: rod shape-determining protein RodA [Candidatus Krumholzibacteriota bacterium]|nr:rod shape-determining protein RodA [Candidatus Krumholzibacteriota bacterium]
MKREFDWLIFVSALMLIGMGLLTLYSVGHVPAELSETVPEAEGAWFHRQLVWALIGISVMAVAVFIPCRYYETLAVLLYGACLALLVIVLVIPARGASRWIAIGPFGLQPSEFMKPALVFLLARFLAEKRKDPNRLRVLAATLLITAIPFLLVKRQPDLGTALVFPAILLPILYWRGLDGGVLAFFVTPVVSAFLVIYSEWSIGEGYPFLLLLFFLFILILAYAGRRRLFQSIMLVGVNLAVMLTVPGVWSRLHVYQQKRVLAFLRPESDILGAGWQVYQSKVSIGSGGFAGKQYLHGTQKLLAFLPERHSDFVFSVLAEELGFIGAMIILVLFTIIIVRGLFLAAKMKSRFASLVAIGICSYFAFHVIVNVGMAIGLAPVTGLPLPFMSYGGSSMLVSCFFVGVLLDMSIRFYEY